MKLETHEDASRGLDGGNPTRCRNTRVVEVWRAVVEASALNTEAKVRIRGEYVGAYVKEACTT